MLRLEHVRLSWLHALEVSVDGRVLSPRLPRAFESKAGWIQVRSPSSDVDGVSSLD